MIGGSMLKQAVLILCLFCFSLEGVNNANKCSPPFKQPPRLSRLCCDGGAIGAVVVGAGAGALAGWAASSKGHRHCNVIDPFKRDEADKLEVELELTVKPDSDFPLDETRSVMIKPFITLPNGEVFLGDIDNSDIMKDTFQKSFTLKSISRPYVGNYQLGCVLEFSENTNVVKDFMHISLKGKVKTRSGTTTVLGEFTPWSFNDIGQNIEVIAEYTYHPKL